ncbi:hypothetical protein RHMOL_Rhmol13G0143400 [Rhododendron molle]|uniref:Uncharacterized protein n=1 Tax=Rhododendron molle TaxID=49168 RepID=A0ACC0L7Y3_RHOML|nr:hypothetical protein RHMOL_Rhmol13G0143400 [Rhododendron molle]
MAEKAAVEKAAVDKKVIPEAEELPKAIVRRVVKEKLSQLSKDGADISVFKEALMAFSESARIFIHYLSAMANDICKESKRQTINAEDVFKALEEMEFPEFVGPLKASLEEEIKYAMDISGLPHKKGWKFRRWCLRVLNGFPTTTRLTAGLTVSFVASLCISQTLICVMFPRRN